MNAYAARNRILKALGFASYEAYLASRLWASIRHHQLVEHPECWGCGVAAKEVHHGNYREETLRGICTKALYSICNRCHRAIEWSGKQKLCPAAATRRLREIRKQVQAGESPKREKPRKLSREQREVLKIERRWGGRYAHQLLAEEDDAAPS